MPGNSTADGAANARRARWAAYHADPAKWFWPRVDSSAGAEACWPWTGRRLRAGYGRLKFKGRLIGANRMALQLASGHSGDGLFACHKCDNPICCNPSHLFWGDHSANMADCSAKGRRRGRARKFDYEAAFAMLDAGETRTAIAKHFGVSISTVSRAFERAALRARKATND